MMTALSITASRQADLTALGIAGEINVRTAEQLAQFGINHLLEPGNAVALDLANVTSIDDAGLEALLRLRTVAAHVGRQLLLLQPPKCVQQILTTTGLDAIFEQVDDITNGIDTYLVGGRVTSAAIN
jgi:anti-anti-sigma factor